MTKNDILKELDALYELTNGTGHGMIANIKAWVAARQEEQPAARPEEEIPEDPAPLPEPEPPVVEQVIPEPEVLEEEPEFMKSFPPKPKAKPFKARNVVKKKAKKK